MRLRSVRLKNIRSYVAASLDFPDGTTLISGDVGSGKTSLLYSIEMALFGTAEIDAAYLVRHGAPHAEVEVRFEDAEHRYAIARTFRRVRRKGKETFEPQAISFSRDGAKTEYSATELRQQVIELLGFADNPSPQAHSDLWRWAVYVPQERMRDILAAKPQDRLETVRRALGVERYRIAAENAQEVATDLRRSVVALRAEAERLRHHDDDFAKWTIDSDRLRVERVELDGAIERRRAHSTAARAAVEAATAAVRQGELDRRELGDLLRAQEADAEFVAERGRLRAERQASIEARERDAVVARAEAAELDSRRRSLGATDSEVARLRSELTSRSAEMRELVRARTELAGATRRRDDAIVARERASAEAGLARARLAELERSGPTHEPPAPTPDALEVIDERLDAARARERSTLGEMTVAETTLREFDELLTGGVCPRCGQTVRTEAFEEHRAEAATRARRAGEEHEGAVTVRTGIEEVRRSRERYERALDHWRQVEREREAARDAGTRSEAAAAAAAGVVDDSASAVEDVRARLARFEPSEGAEAAARQALAAAESARARDAASVEHATLAAERARSSLTAIEVLEAEVGRIDREVAAARGRQADRGERVETLRRIGLGSEERARILAENEAQLAALEEAVEVDRRALVRVDTRLDEAVRRIAEAERGRADRAGRVAEAADLEAKATWTSGPFRESLLEMERKLLHHAQAAFEREFARYFSVLIEDPALVARTDGAFTPLVAIEGELTPAEALSGGERTSLALAFRLALARVVRTLGHVKLDTILLDEPTDGFSPEQVVRMGELLEALALPQVILVSHEDELAGVADRVVRVEKVDGRSVFAAAPKGATERPDPEAARSRSTAQS